MATESANTRQLSDLAAAIRTCDRCPLSATRTHAVPGEGAYDAVVMFVGEGPGHDEDQQGRPFVGRSGQYLTEMLEAAGIQRQDVFIANVVKCRPPQNRDPLPQELEACSDFLDQQVDLINPRIIVTLGRFSMRRWFTNGSITRIHGQVRNIGRGRVALAMFHPAAALRNPEWRDAFARDMGTLPPLIERARKANRLAERGEALPAGVPHPGDADYVPPDSTRAGEPPDGPPAPDLNRANVDEADWEGPNVSQSLSESGLNNSDATEAPPDDDAAQLSLW